MGAPMAWLEHREGHVRVVWRDPDTGGKTYEKFATDAEADIYRGLVEQARGRRPETLYEEPGRPARPLGNLPCTVTRWAEFWLSGLSGVRDRTVADYRGTIERSILPYFGQMDIRDPSPTDVGRWVRSLADRGLSPKTIRNHHGIAHSLFRAALEHEPAPMRSANPCARTRLPEVVQEEMRFLTHQQFDRLLNAAPQFYKPVFTALVGTGLRWGELAGLQVQHVDLLASPPALRVVQSLQRQTDGSYALGPPKTRAARRRVTLPQNVVDAVLPLVAGKEGHEHVFTSRAGTPLRHQNFMTRVWQPALAAAELQGLRIHDLRHTHTAWLIAAGRPLPSIQRRLGHRSITTTIDRYGHVLPDVDAGDLVALDHALQSQH